MKLKRGILPLLGLAAFVLMTLFPPSEPQYVFWDGVDLNGNSIGGGYTRHWGFVFTDYAHIRYSWLLAQYAGLGVVLCLCEVLVKD